MGPIQSIIPNYGEPLCQSLAGTPLDSLVSELVLKALEPAALEISLKVAEDAAAPALGAVLGARALRS